MKLAPWRLESCLLPMVLFGFLATSVKYVNLIFNNNLRWGLLVLLLVYLLVRGRIASVFRGSLSVALLPLLGWVLVTSLWSIVPSLSLAKGISFWFVAVAMFGAGQYWVTRHGMARSLDYALPLVLLAIFAGALGPGLGSGGGSVNIGNSFELYQGLAGGANALGSLMAMAIPLLLWRIYQERKTQSRIMWLLTLVGIIVSLLLSNSRASVLNAVVTSLGMILTLDLRRRQILVSMIALLALVFMVTIPGFWDMTIDRYVYKGAQRQGESAFYTREEVWDLSWQGAQEGGLIGLGYGASFGDTSFAGGLTAVGYGREKGNTQMAIIEETGIVGLGFYAAFLIVLFRHISRAFRWVRTREEYVLLGIMSGALVGCTIQGIFEAWWVAPGSPEAAYWWALVGAVSGVSLILERRDELARTKAPVGQFSGVPPE